MQQLSLTDGLKAQRDGLALVEAHHQRWVDKMRSVAMEISQASGFVSTDNLRLVADTLGMAPKSPHCWGAVFAGSKWEVVGRMRSAVPGNHGREIRVWRYRT